VESNKLIAVGRQWPGDEACITILKLGTNGAAEQEIGEARTDGQGDFTYPRSAALHQGRLLISAGFTSTFNGVPRPGLARFLLEDIPESSIAVGLVRPPWNSKAGQWDLPSEGPVVRSGFGPLFANEGGVSFKVRRLGNSIEPVQVAYASVEGTARAGEDYIARAGALSFAPLEVEKTVTIATINDGIREPEETFALSLTAVTGGEQVGGPASAILLDDDGDAALAVDADKLSVDGIVELTLRAPWYSRWSVESSADLSSWTRLTEVSGSPFGSFIDDSEAGRFPIRFYRAVRMQP
jgi:hypothetical protein